MSLAAHTHRRRLLAVAAVVLGVLCGPAAAQHAVPAAAATRTVPVTAEPTVSAPVPGCHDRAPAGGTAAPAAPVRPSTMYELLPALFEARGAVGGWGPEQGLVPDHVRRGPPSAGPPTPVDLSVLLRV
ncbi:hypothetical protein GCM10018773_15100 [Streptomyces candidus]|nr:hypothetical protein GCM10018773_15100 [Streptomyces candidus]